MIILQSFILAAIIISGIEIDIAWHKLSSSWLESNIVAVIWVVMLTSAVSGLGIV